MNELTRDDLLDVLETISERQLRAIRAMRRNRIYSTIPLHKGKSNISMVEEILKDKGGPLHIDEIVQIANQRFGRKLRRESLVSAITKKIMDEETFCRVGRNTFDLLRRRKEEIP